MALADRHRTPVLVTGMDPTVEALLDVVIGFLCRYALVFRETGAWGVGLPQ